MPTYFMFVDMWGSATNTTTAVPLVPSPTSGTTVWFNNATTTSSTASNIVWVNMSTPVFDSSHNHYMAQVALQQRQMQLMQAQSYMSASQLNGLMRQQLGQLNDPQGTLPEIAAHDARERERRMRDDHDRAQQAVRNREAARNRARDLLMDHLTPAQRDTMQRHGWFVVEGGRSKHPYRIHTDRGPAGNVMELSESGTPMFCLCGHIRTAMVPDYDEYLAQLIMLQADEDAYRALANRSRV